MTHFAYITVRLLFFSVHDFVTKKSFPFVDMACRSFIDFTITYPRPPLSEPLIFSFIILVYILANRLGHD